MAKASSTYDIIEVGPITMPSGFTVSDLIRLRYTKTLQVLPYGPRTMSSGGKGIDLAEGGHADADATTLKTSSSAVIGQQMAAVDDALEQTPQQNWIIAWIKGQITGFSFPLVLMAIKFPPPSLLVPLQLTVFVSRASLPPIIFLAMYRSTPVANEIGSLGYIVAIIASLQFAMQPRSKYLQSLLQNIIFTCAAVPYSILGLYCARVARQHTQAPGDRNRYNSSAAAVSAIFLFVNVYALNVFRAVYSPFCVV